MDFIDLINQEKEEQKLALTKNKVIIIGLFCYFVFLIGLLFFNNIFTIVDSIINLVIIFILLLTITKLQEMNRKKTISYKVLAVFKAEFPVMDFDNQEVLKKVSLKSMVGIGYIFGFENKKIIYTTLDNKIRDYIDEN